VTQLEAAPSRARVGVAAFLCGLAFILYLDRNCWSLAVKPISNELDFDGKWQIGTISAAFSLAYALFEIPVGHWGDRHGSRGVLARIVVCWSVFTAATGACVGFWSLLVVRFLFGAGEAGAFPNVARVLAGWFPLTERGRVQGFVLASSLAGGAASPVLAAYLIDAWGWRWMFAIFGVVGFVWVGAFLAWFRDDPAAHPAVNAAELEVIRDNRTAFEAHHEPLPWRQALSHPAIWLLILLMNCAAFVTYFFYTWYPTYLQEARQVDPRPAGWLTGLVLAMSAVGMFAGGFAADSIRRRSRNPVRPRRVYCAAVYLCAAVLLLASKWTDHAVGSAVLAAASCLAFFLQQSFWWLCAIEVSGKHVGALMGLMNGMGVFGSMGSQLFFGLFADWMKRLGYTGRAQFDPAFYVYAAALVVGAVAWLVVDTSRPIGRTESAAAT